MADGQSPRHCVFDGDTGKFKRMWGAFGNVPTDAAPNPALPDADDRKILALLAGALTSALTGRLVRRFGTRVTMAGSGVAS